MTHLSITDEFCTRPASSECRLYARHYGPWVFGLAKWYWRMQRCLFSSFTIHAHVVASIQSGPHGRIPPALYYTENIAFHLVGTYHAPTNRFELFKTHTGKFTNTMVYRGHIDPDRGALVGACLRALLHFPCHLWFPPSPPPPLLLLLLTSPCCYSSLSRKFPHGYIDAKSPRQ